MAVWGGQEFCEYHVKLSETNGSVRVVNDQYGGPTSAEEVVKVIDLLCHSENMARIMQPVKASAAGQSLQKRYLNCVGSPQR